MTFFSSFMMIKPFSIKNPLSLVSNQVPRLSYFNIYSTTVLVLVMNESNLKLIRLWILSVIQFQYMSGNGS